MGITKEQLKDVITQIKVFVNNKITNVTDTNNTNLTAHVNDKQNPHGITKETLNLGNVDNTADADKPISTAQQAALDLKVPTTRTINKKALSSDVTLSASDVGADASGTANTAVSTHNTSTESHNDIRLLITDLANRLNALADSDDTTLDQMSEVVAYIKANKELIDSITTDKVNVTDIVDNLTTNVSNKPLSAAQGVAVKADIDALETEMAEVKKSVADGKTALATTLSNNGVTTASDATFDTIDTNIGTMATNKYNAGQQEGYASGTSAGYASGVVATKKGTATADKVLAGYTFTNASSVEASGTMINQGTASVSLDCGKSYTIPEGYHSGKGTVTANSLASQTDGTAVAGDILSGKTAYVDGAKVTGTIASKAAATYTPSAKDQTIAAGQYLSGAQTIKGDADLLAANIVKGKEIFGVTGTFSTEATSPITAADILVGKIGFVNGSKITGTMVNNGAVSQALNCGGSYAIPEGYHNGKGKVTANALSSQTEATATAAQLIKGETAWVNGAKITGTMIDYSSNVQIVNSAASTGYTIVDIPAGYHTQVKIDNDSAWEAGNDEGLAEGVENVTSVIAECLYDLAYDTAGDNFDEATIDSDFYTMTENMTQDVYNRGQNVGKANYGTYKYRSVMPSYPAAGAYIVYNYSANHCLDDTSEAHFVIDVTFAYGGYTYSNSHTFDVSDFYGSGEAMHFVESIAGTTVIEIYVYYSYIAVINHSATSISEVALTDYQINRFLEDYDYGTDDITQTSTGSVGSFDESYYS